MIRDYLGGRYGFDSLEMTTDELIIELKRQAGREMILGEIQGWLSACDLVKFAINLAQMQAAQNPQAAALVNSVTVTPSGTLLKVSASLPQDMFTKMLEPAHKTGATLHQRK